MLSVLGPDGISRSVDEHFDTMQDVDQDPAGAWQTIHSQAREIDRLRAAITAARELLVASRFTNSEHSQAMRILDEALKEAD